MGRPTGFGRLGDQSVQRLERYHDPDRGDAHCRAVGIAAVGLFRRHAAIDGIDGALGGRPEEFVAAARLDVEFPVDQRVDPALWSKPAPDSSRMRASSSACSVSSVTARRASPSKQDGPLTARETVDEAVGVEVICVGDRSCVGMPSASPSAPPISAAIALSVAMLLPDKVQNSRCKAKCAGLSRLVTYSISLPSAARVSRRVRRNGRARRAAENGGVLGREHLDVGPFLAVIRHKPGAPQRLMQRTFAKPFQRNFLEFRRQRPPAALDRDRWPSPALLRTRSTAMKAGLSMPSRAASSASSMTSSRSVRVSALAPTSANAFDQPMASWTVFPSKVTKEPMPTGGDQSARRKFFQSPAHGTAAHREALSKLVLALQPLAETKRAGTDFLFEHRGDLLGLAHSGRH